MNLVVNFIVCDLLQSNGAREIYLKEVAEPHTFILRRDAEERIKELLRKSETGTYTIIEEYTTQ